MSYNPSMLAWINENSFIIIAVLAGLLLIGLVWLIRLNWRINKLLAGKKGLSLEEIIFNLGEQVKRTDQVNEQIKQHLVGIEQRLGRSIQHVKTVRFNPFREQGQGGNQSFAVAFLDEQGNGTVISSLYSREKVGVYAKPVTKGGSTHELSAEEKEAIAR